MTVTKVVLIVLALVAVLFVVLVLMGPLDKSTENANSFTPSKHTTLQSMSGVLAPFAPKLSVKSLFPQTHTFDLSLTPSYEVAVLPDTSQRFRQAEFIATPSKYCASVNYKPRDSSGLDKGAIQRSEDSGSSDHPERFSFTVLSGGGTLTVSRSSPLTPGLCVLVLQVAK